MTKSSEEITRQVLAGLRDSEVPAGMERRIVKAAQERAATHRASGWRHLRATWLVQQPMRSRAWGIALAGVIAICVTVPVVQRMGRTRSQRAMYSAPADTPAAPAEVARESRPSPPRPIARPAQRTDSRRTAATRDSEGAARHETLTVSYPAPPMPLTEQEKLLLRIAHKGDPVELAMLDPMLRDARNAEEMTEFQRFFGQPTTGETK